MLPRPLWRANLGYFRRHPWLLVFMWLGVALGASVVAAVEVSIQSAQANFRVALERLEGRATHVIESGGPLDEALLGRLKRDLGVEAGPVLQGQLRVDRAPEPLLQLLATDLLQFENLRGSGQKLRGSLEPQAWLRQPGVILGAPELERLRLDVGDRLPVRLGERRLELRIIAALGSAEDARFERLALMDIGQAQVLLQRRGQLDRIELRLRPAEVPRVRAWLDPALELRDLRSQASLALADSLFLNLRALGLLALVVGLFLVYNSLQFSLVQRQPLLARLRTLGVTQREVRRYLYLELLVLGTLGTLCGLWLGLLLAEVLLDLVTATLNNLYAHSPLHSLQATPQALAGSLVAGLGGTLIAGWWPLRRMARTSPLEAEQRVALDAQSRRQARYQLAAALAAVPAIVLCWLWKDTGLAGGMLAVTLLLLAAALMAPWMIRGAALGLARILGTTAGPVARLAIRDAGRSLSRTGVAMMALTLAVAATLGIAVLIQSFAQTLETWLGQRLNAHLYIAPLEEGSRARLPWQLVSWLEAQPEVAALSVFQRQSLRLTDGHRRVLLVAHLPPQARAGYRFLSGEPDVAWQGFDQGDILLSEPLARQLDLEVGESLRLPSESGQRGFRVAGVYYDYGDPAGRLLVSSEYPQTPWQRSPPRAIGVYLQGSESRALVARLQQQPGARGWRIAATEGVMQRSMAVFAQTFRVTEVLRWLAMGVAFVGMLASLVALQLEREAELRLYRALGMTLRERRQVLLWQALLPALVAGILAIPVGLLLGWALAELVQVRAFGWSLDFSIPLWPLVQAPLLALAAALLAVAYPAWRLGRDATREALP